MGRTDISERNGSGRAYAAGRGAGGRSAAARGKGRRRRFPCVVRLCLAGVWIIGLLAGCAGTGGNAPAGNVAAVPPETEAPSEPESSPKDPEGSEPVKEPVHHGVLIGGNRELLTDEQMEAIFNYMDRYYETLASLEMKELSDLFASSVAGQIAFHENAWEYMIGMRRMQEADLRLDEYLYRMWILGVEEQEDGSVDVDMAEQSLQRFAMMPEVTSVYPGYWHDFQLVRENGRWVLSGHMQWEGTFWNMMKGYQDEDTELLSDPERIFGDRKRLLLSQVEDDLEKRRQQAAEGGEPSQTTEPEPAPLHEYDREAAVAYARAHVDERSGEWHDYSGEGGNCQNFVSQCLLAGGIPMDTDGPERWKWYGEALSDTSEEAGCTLSWINVDYFYAYARDNRGSGLAAQTDAAFDSGQPGDLIMMGTPEDWNHMVIISEVVKDENGRTIDYMICSNTTDVQDFPASAYPSPCRSLIRILGWN